jgi:uncharacterized Ntn-hydrolase superfamily protein
MRPSTFSIVAADPEGGELGIAVQSKFLAVGSAVPWVESGVGAIATQAWANTTFGPLGLTLLRGGASPDDVRSALVAGDDGSADRQFGIVDARGRSSTFTGDRCIPWASGIAGENFAAQGNCLAGESVVSALASTFRETKGLLADRLMAALAAAQREGGDKRGQQSAALVIYKPGGGYSGFNDRYVDLRVDDHPAPIEELARILELHKLYNFAAEPADVLPIDAALGSEIASELRRAGAYKGTSEAYDAGVRDALVAFMHVENLENRVREDWTIDRQTLAYLRAFKR